MKLKAIINIALYVCLCRGVTDRTINAEIARGACTVEEISACTGAGTKCGRCRVEVGEMIEAAQAAQSSLHVARRVSLAVVREAAASPEETRAA